MKTLVLGLLPFIASLFSITVKAQTTVISKSFENLYKGDGSYAKMNTIGGFEGWTFNDDCFAMKSGYMLVGSGGIQDKPFSLGEVITPALGITGNATLLVKFGKSSSFVGKCRISVVGDGEVNSEVYTIDSDGEYRPSAIFIKGLTPSSKIKIEGTDGKFYLRTLKIFSISDAVFYESFDYMTNNSEAGEFYPANNSFATSALCDNSANTTFENSVSQSQKCIYLGNQDAKYQISLVPIPDDSRALLTFKVGNISTENTLKLSCENATFSNSSIDGAVINTPSTSLQINRIPEPYKQWKDCFVVVEDMSSATKLTFQSTNISLNDVMILPIPAGLDEYKDNTTYIKANNGIVSTVTLTRKLTAGIWCPLCLPFDVTPAEMATVTSTTCQLLTLTSVSDGVFNFDPVASSATIPAGTPFLIKTDKLVENPTFPGKMIVNTPAAIASASTTDYQFVGTYSPVSLTTGGTNLFIGTDGILYQPEDGQNVLGGLRAYFFVPANATSRIVLHGIDDASGLHTPSLLPSTSQQAYDLQGHRTDTPATPGVYVRSGRKYLRP